MEVLGKREITKGASFTQDSDEDYNLICLPCHRDGTTVPAFGFCIDCNEHLCHVCYTHHKKPTHCRNHRLQDKDDMPSTQQLDTSVPDSPTDNLTTPCPRHKKEMIKFLCNDHDLLLCSICVTLEHNKTCHVDYIPDISDKMANSHDYKGTLERMDKLLKKCSSVETQTSEGIKKSNDSLKKALMELTKYRQKVNTRIDELQKEIENEIKALEHKNDERKNTSTTICDDVRKTMKMLYDNIKHLNSSNQTDQLFLEVKQAQNQLEEYENCISSISADGDIKDYTFEPNKVVTDALYKEKSIGDVSAQHQAKGRTSTTESSEQRYQPVPTSVVDPITPKQTGKIFVKTSEDRKQCWITSMTTLHPDKLVLVDRSNNSIKLVDVNSEYVIHRLFLGAGRKNEPWDITSTTSTQVAVTVPGSQFIQFMSVSDKLSKIHTLQTDGQCYGICYHEGKLVVTYRPLGKLDILDMNGHVMKRVVQDSAGKDTMKYPNFVRADKSTIYVSDENLPYITLMNWQGQITGRVAGIVSPRGLATLGDGSVLVSDYGGNKVIHVSGNRINKRWSQIVHLPYAVCVGDGGHKLYISQFTLYNDDNRILVYSI